jgi:hypothetical protein
MVYILEPSSIWQQISFFFFFSSGVFNDLLVLRVALTVAYTLLLLSGIMGFPSWSNSFKWSGNISVDTIVWSALNVFLHGTGVIRIYYDERGVDLTDDQAMLWRYIYRHSGLSKAQFLGLICPSLHVLKFAKGQVLPTDGMFYIIRDGVVDAEVAHTTSGVNHNFRMYSGEMFPLQHMYIDYMPQQNVFIRTTFKPIAATAVTVYGVPKQTLKDLSKNHETKDAWMGLLIASLAEIAERPYARQNWMDILSGGETVAVSEDRLASQRSPLFNPLQPSEEPEPLLAGSTKALSRPFAHLWKYCKLSVYIPWPFGAWPIGLRHSLHPPTDPDAEKLWERIARWESASLRHVVESGRSTQSVDRIVPPEEVAGE